MYLKYNENISTIFLNVVLLLTSKYSTKIEKKLQEWGKSQMSQYF